MRKSPEIKRFPGSLHIWVCIKDNVLIDTGDYAEDFLRVSKEYFGGNASLQKQLKYIIDEGTKRDPLINLKYALYVYVRSLYICRSTEVTPALRDRLHSLEEDIARKNKCEGWKLTGHPSELIFIYMGLIESAAGDNEAAKQYMLRAENSLGTKGLTEEVICRYGAIELADLQQDLQERDQKAYDLCIFMKGKFPVFADSDIPNEKSECYAWLQKRSHICFAEFNEYLRRVTKDNIEQSFKK